MFNPYWMVPALLAGAVLAFALMQVRHVLRRGDLRGPSPGFTIDLEGLTEELTTHLSRSLDTLEFPEPRLSGHAALPWWRRYG
ncbi:MAG: hypothetical protein ACHQIO_08250 [Nevskiales bacterium]